MNIDIQKICTIAREAGEIIMEIYNRSEGIKFDRKADNSPLTEADQAANAHIVKELSRLYPEIPIISEEEKEAPYKERRKWKQCWQVDPLDGTKEFIKRNGEFTVNIALLKNGRSVAGVVHAPALGLTAWAEKGRGAFEDDNGKVSQLESKVPEKGEPICLVASRSHSSPDMEAFLAQFENPKIRSAGSSLKFLLVARGEAHLYPRLAPTMEWDTSSGQIILEEAGGEVLVAETAEPMVYNRENLRNGHFLAYAKNLRKELKNYFKS